MTIVIKTIAASPLSTALGWTLLHSLWEGALIAAALAAALAAMRSPKARYGAACFAMFLIVAGFGFTLFRMLPDRSSGAAATGHHALPAWILQPGLDLDDNSHPGLTKIIPWLAPLWMTGVGLFYLGHLVSWFSVCRLRRRGICCAPEFWQMRLSRLSRSLHLSRTVQLLESCMVDAPMVLGHIRPVILMPLGLLGGLPVAQIEAIFLHELAHIRRHDYLINAVQRLVEGLMFYHPAAWWISRVIRFERENCCDDVAVAMSGDPHEYAAALAVLEENRHASVREPALAATGGSLVKRINRLLYPKTSTGAWTPLLATAILITTVTVGLSAWQVKPAPQKTGDQPAGTLGVIANDDPSDQQNGTLGVLVSDDSYKWLNEDVVYIIGDEERAAYQKLTTDDERQKFIEQFWLRRDPAPGAVKNEFKEEHYRRIAYANERFSTSSGRSGWQTDRGHMYIVYGPPDEIEAHPSGEPGFFPHETWMYHHIDGIGDKLYFTFVDRARTGDYHLAPANGH